MTLKYTRFSESIETVKDDEEEKTKQICASINDNQRRNFHLHRHAFRGTHLKTQALVKGKMTVSSDLPPYLAQGIFSKAGATYDIAMRYANEPFKIMDDKVNAPRGIGMRVFNVSGDRISPLVMPGDDDGNDKSTSGTSDRDGDSGSSQDFTFNNAPVLELRNVDTYLEIEQLRTKYWDQPTALKAALATRHDALLQLAPSQLPNENIVAHEMYSQSAFRFGDHVAKYALFPATDSQRALASQKIGKDDPDYRLQEMLEQHFASTETTYAFRVQLMHEDERERQPVEDAGVEWSQHASPYQTVALVTIPAQGDAFGHARRVFWEDRMSLDVWRGLEAHRPLGSINRCRRMAYAASRKYRTETNHQPLATVERVEDIP